MNVWPTDLSVASPRLKRSTSSGHWVHVSQSSSCKRAAAGNGRQARLNPYSQAMGVPAAARPYLARLQHQVNVHSSQWHM